MSKMRWKLYIFLGLYVWTQSKLSNKIDDDLLSVATPYLPISFGFTLIPRRSKKVSPTQIRRNQFVLPMPFPKTVTDRKAKVRIMEGRPSSSGSVIYHPDAPKTYIYPPRETIESSGRPSSSGTVIYHADAPITIIYPARDRHRGKVLKSTTGPEKSKRKRGDSPPPEQERPESQTYALVVLLQRNNLPMATDFAAFHKEFDYHGIQAEYKSIFDLEQLIEDRGDLIYGRDDLPGREREVILKKGHSKFYTVIPEASKMKREILAWLRSVVRRAKRDDNIVLVLISHGTKGGSVSIGGETAAASVAYLTSIEVREAVVNLPRYTYFTLINTCCYSGGWINIAKTGLGKRFVHAASGARTVADNHVSNSGKYRGGVFVTALLECLKRNKNGTLSQFVGEIKAEVTAYRHPDEPNITTAAPTIALSNTDFWKRPINAFIPIQAESTLAQTVVSAVADMKTPNLHSLFQKIHPARIREMIPDELVPEIEDARRNAVRRGGANGEDQLYEASRTLLEGETDEATKQALFRTISWRERANLEVRRIARHLEDSGIITDSMPNVDEEKLSKEGDGYYKRVFSGSKIIDLTKLPPQDCLGGQWENPYTWLSNVIGVQPTPVNPTNLRKAVEIYIAESVISKRKSEEGKE